MFCPFLFNPASQTPRKRPIMRQHHPLNGSFRGKLKQTRDRLTCASWCSCFFFRCPYSITFTLSDHLSGGGGFRGRWNALEITSCYREDDAIKGCTHWSGSCSITLDFYQQSRFRRALSHSGHVLVWFLFRFCRFLGFISRQAARSEASSESGCVARLINTLITGQRINLTRKPACSDHLLCRCQWKQTEVAV